LKRRGIDVAAFRPSAPLEPFLLQHGDHIWQEISKFDRGRLPSQWNIRHRWWFSILQLLSVLGFVTLFAAGIIGMSQRSTGAMIVASAGAVAWLSTLPILLLTRRWHNPIGTSIEGIETLADLCRALAVQWRAQGSLSPYTSSPCMMSSSSAAGRRD
jgi:hypothetical protein